MVQWCNNCGMGKDCPGYDNLANNCSQYIPMRFDGSVKE